jgi:hypothetical protein
LLYAIGKGENPMKARSIGALVSAATPFLLLAVLVQQGAVKAKPNDSRFINAVDSPHASYETLVSCPFVSGAGNDNLSRGFYIQIYPGANLGTVQVTYQASVSGTYAISMTARTGTYTGTLIGTTQTASVTLPASTYVTATFDFGGALVISGTAVTFSQGKVNGAGSVFYNTGPCGFDLNCTLCPGVYQTDGTSPPLDTTRRRSVAVTIAQVKHHVYLPLVMK